MEFRYIKDAVKYEYKVKYLDASDAVVTTYINAYSEKQAIYLIKKLRKGVYKILDVEEMREIPDENGQQVAMDFGEQWWI